MAFYGFGTLSVPAIRLEPCVKPGKTPSQKHPQGEFETKKGPLLVPQLKDPPDPTHDMIAHARQGILKGFFRDGHIFCASDLIGSVSQLTANITLEEVYDYQTRPLIFKPSVPEAEKSLRYLYYISLKERELPSFHFWISPSDKSPLQNFRPNVQNRANDSISTALKGVGDTGSAENQLTDSHGQTIHITERTSHGSEIYSPSIKIISHSGGDSSSQKPSAASVDAPNPASGLSDAGLASRRGSTLNNSSTIEAKDTPVLLRFQKGGMYLKEYTNNKFVEMAEYLTNEQDENLIGGFTLLVDVFCSKTYESQEYQIASGIASTQTYHRHVKPHFGKENYHFRIRSDALAKNSPWNNSRPGSLKITRVGVGYYYVDAAGKGFDDPTKRSMNSDRIKKALNFLFGMEGARPESLTLQLPPKHDAFDIDYSSDSIVPAHLGAILQEIATSSVIVNGPLEPISFQYSAEIFVHTIGEAFVHPLTLATQARSAPEEASKQIEESRAHGQQQSQDKTRTDATPETANQPVDNPILKPTSSGMRKVSNSPSEAGQSQYQEELDRLKKECDDLRYRDENQQKQVNWIANDYDALVKKSRDQAIDAIRERERLSAFLLNLQIEVSNRRGECERLRASEASLRSQVQRLELERDRLLREAEDMAKNPRSTASAPEAEDNLKAPKCPDPVKDAGTVPDTEEPQPEPEPESHPVKPGVPSITDQEAANDAGADHEKPGPSNGYGEPGWLLYCNKCLKSVDKIGDNAKTKHAENCRTDISSFILLTPAQAKDRRMNEKKQREDQIQGEARHKPYAKTSDSLADPPLTPRKIEGEPTDLKSGRRSKRKRDGDQAGESDEDIERPTKKGKALSLDGKSPAGKRITRSRRNRKTREPSSEMIDPDGDSSAPEIGATRKHKSNPPPPRRTPRKASKKRGK